MVFLLTKDKRRQWRLLLLPFFFAVGFFCLDHAFMRQSDEASFCSGTDGQSVFANGYISRVTERTRSTELILEDATVISPEGERKIARLSAVVPAGSEVWEGDFVGITGKLTTYERATNPGQFDYAAYQAAWNIHLQVTGREVEVTVSKARIWERWIGWVRREGMKVFLTVSPENGGTMAAMTLGDKSRLDEARYSLYLDSGIGHILTLSGLHLSLFGVTLFGILRRRVTFGVWPASCLIALLILGYVQMSGGGISASRAAIALVLSLLAGCLGKSYDALSAASLGMILILSQYPLQVTRPSFWLSFGAVIALGWILPELIRWLGAEKKGRSAFLVSLTVSMALTPVTAISQYILQPYSILLNLLAVPFMGPILFLCMTVLFIGAISPQAAAIPAAAVRYLLQFLDGICRLSRRLPGNRIPVGYPPIWRLVLYGILLGGFVWYICRVNRLERAQPASISGRGSRYLILAAVVFLLAASIGLSIGGRTLQITFLDVGQGDCICIRTPNKTSIVVDGGSSSIGSVGEYRIEPYLAWAGVGEIDYLVMTHLDEDHMNGLLQILASGFPVRTLLLSPITTNTEKMEEICRIAKENNTEVVNICANDRIVSGKVEITCIYPESASYPGSENEASIVLELIYGNFSCLLTGDLEGRGEQVVTDYLAGGSPITLLKVAHHGSRNSTSEAFLAKSLPYAAVISCGQDNFYGHPHAELIERLKSVGCRIWCTADCGAVTVQTDGRRLKISGYAE